jgi:hypothetical protein
LARRHERLIRPALHQSHHEIMPLRNGSAHHSRRRGGSGL